MGQAQLSVEDFRDDSVAAQAAAAYRSRGVPTDWYVDPADPDAAEFHERENRQVLADAATAFLTAHELQAPTEPALDQGLSDVEGADPDPIWIGLGLPRDDFSDEGELGWQTDALCAQTDPEAFFPEKGGSTRDAKKVCGACNVKAQCLEYALANDERFGIWGGLSERERRRLRKRAV
ncbi:MULTISPECIES: WhiB family transcriptional regulator [Arthrobacter]|uniref:Transcriptional regulator WhiB n=1 Tax=Arthrobacter psychrochitiniphilus TaxID=291045 RepID=A0A2V3DVG6_9MICC|nr:MULTISPECIES: WhiB family transcriptional regulator [Arthrobacter]NYG16510.1 WhiB family redox-sensing transcriptional regulator [Arthrobacter psychrochitiniphilus]PXA69358.1 WhiB family transcriptional regulator [Arthrobacter psychrochitiniphilus]